MDTLAYAKRLREAGFSEEQAEGQAQALAAAMTDALATKQDLRDLELRMDARFARVDARFDHIEKHLDSRLAEQYARLHGELAEQSGRFHAELADLERRMTLRLGSVTVAGIGVVSALVKLL
jgi:hypothetical protein